MAEEIKMGIYRHFKKNEYRVLYTAVDTETKEEMVVYQDLADENKIWVRPKKMFLSEVEVDGKKKLRFEFIGEEENDPQKKPSGAEALEDKYLRALADYQNLLKQTAKEKMEFALFANEIMLKEILPVYDHLKMALSYHNGQTTDEWVTGLNHVVKQFQDALAKVGVEEIISEGKKFDHNIMEAVGSEETDDEKLDCTVVKQVKAGYKLNGKVIEAAKVIVYKMK